jgi:peptidoglycan-N-acetylglucosamine deacetylase
MMTLLIFAAFFVAVVAWFAMPVLVRRWQERGLAKSCASKRVIVLSYDDGPGAILTDQLADLLRRRKVRATFFMIGQRAGEHSDSIARLLRDKHEIGGHTQCHFNAWKVNPWRAVMDMRAGQHTLKRMGVQPRHFRPPYGKATPATLLFGLFTRVQFSYWTVDTRDSWEEPRSVAVVLAMIRSQGGGVVLMHDCDAPSRSVNPKLHPERILALTEAIIDLAAKEGFSIVPFGEIYDTAKGISMQGHGNV